MACKEKQEEPQPRHTKWAENPIPLPLPKIRAMRLSGLSPSNLDPAMRLTSRNLRAHLIKLATHGDTVPWNVAERETPQTSRWGEEWALFLIHAQTLAHLFATEDFATQP